MVSPHSSGFPKRLCGNWNLSCQVVYTTEYYRYLLYASMIAPTMTMTAPIMMTWSLLLLLPTITVLYHDCSYYDYDCSLLWWPDPYHYCSLPSLFPTMTAPVMTMTASYHDCSLPWLIPWLNHTMTAPYYDSTILWPHCHKWLFRTLYRPLADIVWS